MKGSRWFGFALVLVLIALVGYWFGKRRATTVTREPIGTLLTRQDSIEARFDCPEHQGVFIQFPGGDTTTFTQLSVPGPLTLIPEFHDCQRLISQNGVEYGPLVGIFASDRLNQMTVTGARYVDPEAPLAPVTPRGAAVVTIPNATQLYAFVEAVAWGDYGPLGIKKGINCLYVVPDAQTPSGLKGKMFSVIDETECDKGVDEVQGNMTPLDATILLPESEFNSKDYPAAARWDWDTRHQWWVIGVKCGGAWCIISPENSQSTVDPPHQPPSSAGNSLKRRVFRIKGWYDEQRLAVNGSTGLLPGPHNVTAFPAHNLGDYDLVEDFKDWKLVANVDMRASWALYTTKLGFSRTNPGGPYNEVRICQGTLCNVPQTTPALNCTKDVDGNVWYARITAPNGVSTYRCVNNHRHSNYDPPATVRWRWTLKDETLWTRCAEGCCEVTGIS
jgi:Putative intracellular protease/amidase